MKRLLSTLLAFALCATVQAQKTVDVSAQSEADEVIVRWDNSTAPHSNEETLDESMNDRLEIGHTSQTVFFLYKADKSKATGQAVVCIPGGGYHNVCIKNEGFALAKYFQSIGVTALVLKYRLPNNGHKIVPLEDAQEAVKYLRSRADELGFDAKQVGVCGSSAGGHLAAYVSNFTNDADKPNFSILFYPVITGDTWRTHHGSFINLLGNNRTNVEQKYYSLENRVTETTPPTLLLLCDDDSVVPPISSILYYTALKDYGIKASMHIYPSGGHGWAGTEYFKYKAEYKNAVKEWLSTLK